MKRRQWILSALVTSACANKTQPPVFPSTVADVWQLNSSGSFPAGAVPETVRAIGTRGWWSATYAGPGSATVELYELTSSAGGLEMVQKWRPVADTVVWYTSRYFVVVKWHSPDRGAVAALIRALQQQFAETQ